jgi:hypothetical protein
VIADVEHEPPLEALVRRRWQHGAAVDPHVARRPRRLEDLLGARGALDHAASGKTWQAHPAGVGVDVGPGGRDLSVGAVGIRRRIGWRGVDGGVGDARVRRIHAGIDHASIL